MQRRRADGEVAQRGVAGGERAVRPDQRDDRRGHQQGATDGLLAEHLGDPGVLGPGPSTEEGEPTGLVAHGRCSLLRGRRGTCRPDFPAHQGPSLATRTTGPGRVRARPGTSAWAGPARLDVHRAHTGSVMDADVIVVGAGLAGLAAAAEVADAGRRVLLLDQEPEQSLGGQAFWSLGGLFMVDTPEQRRMGIRDSLDLALQDWFGSAQFDRPEDFWPRRWAEAYVHFAAGEKRSWLREQGHRFVPGGRLGRARRRSRRRARQLGAALPPDLGHRPRGGRAVRAPGPRARRHRPDLAALPAPGRRAGQHRRRRHRGPRRRPRAQRGGAGGGVLPDRGRRLRAGRPGRRRHLRRDRRQPRPGPRGLAGAAGHAAAADGRRGAGPRRRPDAGDHRGQRRPDHQPRPDVALHRGAAQLGPDLGQPRHPDPARPVVAVARRDRGPAPGAVLPGLRHPRHAAAPPEHRPRPLLVRAHPEDHREGVRALGVRAEPGPDRQGHPAAAVPGAARRPGTGGGVQGARRGLRGRARPAHAGRPG